jgi:hypothetical protein
MIRVTVLIGVAVLLGGSPAWAKPSTKTCLAMWNKKPDVKGEKALKCTPTGSPYKSKQIGGKHYLYDVATCWSYDVLALKKCGCRLFTKTSICCRKGDKECEFRIGNSTWVDCGKVGYPTYGLSGNTSPECAAAHGQESCFKQLKTLAGVNLQSRSGFCAVYFDCPGGKKTTSRFEKGECALAEECGCTLSPCYLSAKEKQCYDDFAKDKAAQACWKKGRGGRAECYRALK